MTPRVSPHEGQQRPVIRRIKQTVGSRLPPTVRGFLLPVGSTIRDAMTTVTAAMTIKRSSRVAAGDRALAVVPRSPT
jgi:hypothetical protein